MSSINTQSSITHKNTHDLISDYFKNIFSEEQDNELNLLKNKLHTLDGAKVELQQRMNYNYLFAMMYMVLFIILLSLLFTSYFSKSTSNRSNTNSTNLNTLSKLNNIG